MNTPRYCTNVKSTLNSQRSLHFSENELSPELIEKKTYLTRWINSLVKPKIEFSYKESTMHSEKIYRTTSNNETNIFLIKESFSSKSDQIRNIQKAAALLFRDPSIKEPLIKISNAIDRDMISIKSEINLREDLWIKNQIIKILISYEPIWLQLGLETVFNEVAPVASSLQMWLENLFLLDNKTTSFYKMSSQKHSNNQFFLKRWISLVFFLDKAKIAKLFPHDPCLFQKESLIQSSRDVLLKISSLILSGIGDIIRFFKFYGYILEYEESYLSKFEYKVNNILEDLRDGIRLVKIVEILLGNKELSTKLKIPPISENQKIQNVQIALDALSDINFQVQGQIIGKEIVNGHPEKTLSLIWQLVHNLQEPKLEKAAIKIQKWWRKVENLKKQRELYNNGNSALN